MKDIISGAAFMTAMIVGGGVVGAGIAHVIMGSTDMAPVEHPVWYCIDGKVYEKFGDTYATVVPARSCLPVSKD